MYNNNVYLKIDRMFNKLFKNYIIDFVNEFENRYKELTQFDV